MYKKSNILVPRFMHILGIFCASSLWEVTSIDCRGRVAWPPSIQLLFVGYFKDRVYKNKDNIRNVNGVIFSHKCTKMI